MDLTSIETYLRKRYAMHDDRIVYWHDPEGEFDEDLATIEGVALHDDGVTVVRIGNTGQFALKIRLLVDESDKRFLIYQNGPQTDPNLDFLLDIKTWAHPFAADKSTLILRELNLIDDLSRKAWVSARPRFFASGERLQRLKKLVAAGDKDVDLDLKIMSLLARAKQALIQTILLCVIEDMDADDWTADSKILAEFERYDVLDRFWEVIGREFRYAETKPSLRNLLLRLFATDFIEHSDSPAPSRIKDLVLPNGGGKNALVFMDVWRDSSAYHPIYDRMAAVAAEDLHVADVLGQYHMATLSRIDTFLCVETHLASLLTRQIDEAAEHVDVVKIRDLAKTRQDAYWANEQKPATEAAPRVALHCVYEALIHAASFLALKGEFGAKLTSDSAEETWKLYTGKLYRFDQLYRLFSEAADIADGQAWDILKTLREHIEAIYGNWFLAELGNLWTQQVEHDLLPDWKISGISAQYDFFRKAVKPQIEGDSERRVVVIVSDAFRYEAGQELCEELNGRDRWRAELSSMLGVLPSYTKLGMASLLPHAALSYTPDGNVLVDGKASTGVELRGKILSGVGGIAIRAEDFRGMSKDRGKEFVRPHKMIYIYHNQIDQTADTGNEEQTFVAVRRSIDEIQALIQQAFNFNCNLAFVTADHGFLFQSAKLTEAHKNTIEQRPAGTIVAKKRYLIGNDLGQDPGAISGRIASTAKLEGDTEFWVPKGVNRFHFVGGRRIVHGGAMPQEICVPLIKVTYARGEGRGRETTRVTEIGVALIAASNRITTSRHRFTLMQTEAVTARKKAITVKVALYDEDKQISNAETVTFDSALSDMNAWRKDIWLTLANQTFDPRKSYKLIVRKDDQTIVVESNLFISLAFDNDF